jgi:hypothetical protein
MTATRDPDRLIGAFLEQGPAVMTDRVLEAIRDDVDASEQRAGFGPWRNLTMIRRILVTAAVVAAIAAGLAVYSAVSPNIGIDPPPEATLEATPQATPVPEDFPRDGTLEVGASYVVPTFGEPVTFTIPESLTETEVLGDTTDARGFRVDAWEYGIATFHDDVMVPDDLCEPTSVISLPTTPEAVAAWLTGASGATVSEPAELIVAGRRALAFDVALGPGCYSGGEPPAAGSAFWFQAGEHHRVYAIPTGDDTILAVTWGTAFGGEGEEFLDTANAAFDELVRSMRFD